MTNQSWGSRFRGSSLRGAKRRSNPLTGKVRMDCFAALAMTELVLSSCPCPGHDALIVLVPNPLNQVLFADDLAEPAVIRNEFLDEFVDTVLEDIVHVAVFQAIADAAGMALGCSLAAIGDADLVEIAHQIAVATR